MLAERQRVQHQQLYEIAKHFVTIQELMQTLINKLGARDMVLTKLGVEEMIKDTGVRVESVEQFDEDKGTP
jgi:hypothetical protein